MPKTAAQLITEAERLAKQEREAREKLNTLRIEMRHAALSSLVTPSEKAKLLTLARRRPQRSRRSPAAASE
jgi:hypothetical protein